MSTFLFFCKRARVVALRWSSRRLQHHRNLKKIMEALQYFASVLYNKLGGKDISLSMDENAQLFKCSPARNFLLYKHSTHVVQLSRRSISDTSTAVAVLATSSAHAAQLRPRSDGRGDELASDGGVAGSTTATTTTTLSLHEQLMRAHHNDAAIDALLLGVASEAALNELQGLICGESFCQCGVSLNRMFGLFALHFVRC